LDNHPSGSRDSSSSFSWIWGVLLVVVLGAAAVTTALRRRRG
jgi:hypothetical protein